MTAAAVLAGMRLCPTRIRGTLQCSCAAAGSAKRVSGSKGCDANRSGRQKSFLQADEAGS